MKKISLLLFIVLLAGTFSCKNKDVVFPDFDYSTVYFPYQTPVRTLVLGDYEYNTVLEDDNNLNFLISAHMGGVYQNTSDRVVKYIIDTSLSKKLSTSTGDIIEALPSSYYTISPVNQFIIPKGNLYAGFSVQLKDSFLDDTMAYKTHYIIPVRIMSSTLDSVLSGKSSVDNPDRRIANNWNVVPLDYTLFGIKFINPYDGSYLHRGTDVIKDANLATIGTVVYHQPNVENDEIWSLQTIGKRKVTVIAPIKVATGTSPGSLKMDLNFDVNGNCTITNNPASAFSISGTGKFAKDGGEWGGKKRNALFINYTVKVAANSHVVNDTLVIRDRSVTFESFVPVVNK